MSPECLRLSPSSSECYGRLEKEKYEASMGILQRYLTTDDNNGEGRGGGGEMSRLS